MHACIRISGNQSHSSHQSSNAHTHARRIDHQRRAASASFFFSAVPFPGWPGSTGWRRQSATRAALLAAACWPLCGEPVWACVVGSNADNNDASSATQHTQSHQSSSRQGHSFSTSQPTVVLTTSESPITTTTTGASPAIDQERFLCVRIAWQARLLCSFLARCCCHTKDTYISAVSERGAKRAFV